MRWTPLDRFIARGAEGHLVVVRAVGGLETAEAVALQKAAEGYLGRNYDTLFRWDDERIYCSELVYKAYEAIGREMGDRVPLRTFDLDPPAVQALIRARARTELNLDEPVVAPASMLDHPGFEIVQSTDPQIQ